jgi:hypothetical protein
LLYLVVCCACIRDPLAAITMSRCLLTAARGSVRCVAPLRFLVCVPRPSSFVRSFSAAPAGQSVTPEEAKSVQTEASKFDPQTSPIGLTGGAPEEFVRRTCRIYKPSRSASQQGPEYRWKIEFDTPNKWVTTNGHRRRGDGASSCLGVVR